MRRRIPEGSVRGGQSARILIRCGRGRWPSYSCRPVCTVQTIHSEPIRDSESIHSRTHQLAVLNAPESPRECALRTAYPGGFVDKCNGIELN